jgi:hypothetical protein
VRSTFRRTAEGRGNILGGGGMWFLYPWVLDNILRHLQVGCPFNIGTKGQPFAIQQKNLNAKILYLMDQYLLQSISISCDSPFKGIITIERVCEGETW